MWKEAVIVYCKAVSQAFPGGPDENHKGFQFLYTAIGLRIETGSEW
jgi:hypothetical protein